MSSNSKVFKVVFTDGTDRTINADEAVVANNRLEFLRAAEGQTRTGRTDLVASFLADAVAEYSVIAAADQVYTGANTYRVTFLLGGGGAGGTKDVVADKVMYNQHSEANAGQFSLVTKVGTHDTRTEFAIGEAQVFSIARITDVGAVNVPLPTRKSTASDVSSV